MPQLFQNNSEITQEYLNSPEMNYDNILTSPQIIQIPSQRTIQSEQPVTNIMNLIESQYYEPSIPLNQSPKNEPPDENNLNCFDDFQIDDNVINNLNDEMLSSFNNHNHTFNNDVINSPENSSEEINDLLIFPTINSYDETNQNSNYAPVTTQVNNNNTTMPSFYTSIINNIPVYGDQIAPILSITSTPYMSQNSYTDNSNSIDDSLQSYDMGFLNEWANEELIGNLYRS
ncbi:hypothetical protein C1645_792537 [Glomus cerebriforme]|uniref:Uncharacterized protein n=1 Tax=Glomus cerebriforme TaxID=658196 RepID=A0A397S812_9GLOM|nr:hypothetical protein C1645_792537 [Glomus cerebriforme]